MRSIQLEGGTVERMTQSEGASSSAQLELSSDSFRFSWPQEKTAGNNIEHPLLGNSTAAQVDPSVAKAVKSTASGLASIRRSHASSSAANGQASSVKKNGLAKLHSPDGPHEVSAEANGAMLPIGLSISTVTTKQDGPARTVRQGEGSKVSGTSQQTPGSAIAAAGQESSKVQTQADDQPAPVSNNGASLHEASEVKDRGRHSPASSKDDASGSQSVQGLQLITNGPRAGSSDMASASTSLQPSHLALSSSRTGKQLDVVSVTPSIVQAPQTVSSTPTKLEVGVFNGTHGWLQIRAELGATGAVNASVTGVDAAHDALHSAVPEIANYLGGEAVKVSSLEVHRFADGAGMLAGMSTEEEPNRQQQHDDQAKNIASPSVKSLPSPVVTGGNDLQQQSEMTVGGRRGESMGRGTWLNVCA